MKEIATRTDLFDHFKRVFKSIGYSIIEWYNGMNIRLNSQDYDELLIEYNGLDELLLKIGYNKTGLKDFRSFSGVFSITGTDYSTNYMLHREFHKVNINYLECKTEFTMKVKLFTIKDFTIQIFDRFNIIPYPNDLLKYRVKNIKRLSPNYDINDAYLLSIKRNLRDCITELESNKIIREKGLGLHIDYKDLFRSFHESIKETRLNNVFYWGQSVPYSYELRWVILLDDYLLEEVDVKNNVITKTTIPGWSLEIDITTIKPK